MKYQFLSMMGVVALLGACAGTTDSDPRDEEVVHTLDLQGKWLSGCEFDPDDGLYWMAEMEFSGNTFTNDGRGYSQSDCIGVVEDTLHITGSITIGDSITTASGVEAFIVNLVVNYWGLTYEHSDIYKRDDDLLYSSVDTEDFSTPTEIDFSQYFVKQ